MKMIDGVYWREEIKEQILVDLIISKTIQKFDGISQFGMSGKYYCKKRWSD